MAKKPIKITEVVLRDAHQSLLATRMTMDEMRPILPEMDKIPYFSVECWGGATFDSCIRFLDEDPWERLRILRKELPHQKLQMLFRGQNMLGYRPYADDAVEYFVKKSVANGIDVIRIFDALNDARNLQTAIKAANNEHVLQNQFLLDATFRGDYAPDTLECANRLAAVSGGTIEILDEDLEIMREAALYNDYLGVNNYQCRFLKAYDGENDLHHNGTGEKGTGRWRVKGIGEHVNKPGIPTTDWDWIIYPEGLFDLLVYIKQRYPNYKQIFITENGMGYKDPYKDGFVDDQPRIDYIEQHLRWLLKAMEVGVNVGGYFLWSLQDQFSWTNGYNKRYGFFYVDFETQKRTPKASAYWYKHVAQTRRLD